MRFLPEAIAGLLVGLFATLIWWCAVYPVDHETKVEHGCVVQYVRHGAFADFKPDPDVAPVCP